MDRQEKILSLYRQRDRLLLLSLPGLTFLVPGIIWLISNFSNLTVEPGLKTAQMIIYKTFLPFFAAYIPFKLAEFKHLKINQALLPNDEIKRTGFIELFMNKLTSKF